VSRGTRQSLFACLLGAVCFVLGWLVGRSPPSGHPRTTPSARPVASVEIRIDAGAVKLVPDAELHLSPIEPLDVDELAR
jgi:hypothetical protein